MRRSRMLIFFGTVLLIYSLACIFVYLQYNTVRTYFQIPLLPYFIAFLSLSSFFILGRVLERVYPRPLVFFIVKVGAFFMGTLLYLFLFLVAEKVLLGIVRLFHIIDNETLYHTNVYLRIAIFVIVVLMLILGYLNALHTRIRKLALHTSKLPAGHPGITLFIVTDVHLGSIRGLRSVSRLVRMINQSNSDLVLFGGDTLDEDVAPVIAQNIGENLRKITAVYGVFGISGNHEYIGGITSSAQYLNTHGIRLLMDECLDVGEYIQLVGRIDRDMKRFSGRERLPLPKLLENKDPEKYVILLDHQPFGLQEACDQGIDLQISGHTHDGQLWPFNLITRKIYELSTGTMVKGDTHYVISSGYGTWGPPVRIMTQPEVWQIRVEPKKG